MRYVFHMGWTVSSTTDTVFYWIIGHRVFLVHSKQINETEPSISVKDIHAITMDLDAMDSLSFHYTLADIGFKTLNKTKT